MSNTQLQQEQTKKTESMKTRRIGVISALVHWVMMLSPSSNAAGSAACTSHVPQKSLKNKR
jgi:hypothetical protein